MFCEGHGIGANMGQANYMMFYAVDITYVYEGSIALVVREVVLSVAASVGMALLLVWMIKKITRPLQAANDPAV